MQEHNPPDCEKTHNPEDCVPAALTDIYAKHHGIVVGRSARDVIGHVYIEAVVETSVAAIGGHTVGVG